MYMFFSKNYESNMLDCRKTPNACECSANLIESFKRLLIEFGIQKTSLPRYTGMMGTKFQRGVSKKLYIISFVFSNLYPISVWTNHLVNIFIFYLAKKSWKKF